MSIRDQVAKILPQNLNPTIGQSSRFETIQINVHLDNYIICEATFESEELKNQYIEYLEKCKDLELELIFAEGRFAGIGYAFDKSLPEYPHPHVYSGQICSGARMSLGSMLSLNTPEKIVKYVLTLISSLVYIWPISAYTHRALTKIFGWCPDCDMVFSRDSECACDSYEDDDDEEEEYTEEEEDIEEEEED